MTELWGIYEISRETGYYWPRNRQEELEALEDRVRPAPRSRHGTRAVC